MSIGPACGATAFVSGLDGGARDRQFEWVEEDATLGQESASSTTSTMTSENDFDAKDCC